MALVLAMAKSPSLFGNGASRNISSEEMSKDEGTNLQVSEAP